MKLLNSAMNVSSNEMKKPYVACLLCSSKIELKLRQHVFIQHSMVSHGQFLAFLFLEIKQYVYFPVEARTKNTRNAKTTFLMKNTRQFQCWSSKANIVNGHSQYCQREFQRPLFGNILFTEFKQGVAKLQCRLKIGTETGRSRPN